nr:ABC-type transport auxiliary lipoprotein family protein [Caballeronia hypogeia]
MRAFDSMPGSAVALSVSWSILTPGQDKVLNGRSVVLQRVEGDDYDALVDAQSRALAAVSGDMADAIMSAIKKKPPSASGRIFEASIDAK